MDINATSFSGIHSDEWAREMMSRFPDSIVFRFLVVPEALTWKQIEAANRCSPDANSVKRWVLARAFPDLPLTVREVR